VVFSYNAFLVPDSCRATERNDNRISADVTDDIIASDIHRFSEICTSFRNTFIWYLTTMYVYCVYPATSKSPRQLTICLKITERSVVLIACNDVVCDVSAYSVIVSFCRSTWIGYQKCIITKYHWCLLDPPLLVLHKWLPKRKTSHVTGNEKGDLSLQVIALKMWPQYQVWLCTVIKSNI
jgi:hypothetical protein